MADRCLLYYITDRSQFRGDEKARRHALLAKVAEAARAGVDYIQLGNSETQPDRFPQRNPDLFPGDFVRAYTDDHVSYYDVKASCSTGRIKATSGP